MLNLGRLLLVLVVLSNVQEGVGAKHRLQATPKSVKTRYYPLSLVYRREILEGIESPSSIRSNLLLSNPTALPKCLSEPIDELRLRIVASGNPIYLLMSLRW
jgi:hypothetical protein